MFIRESVMVGGQPLTIETGRLAKQAESAVLVTYGETAVLVTVCYSEPRGPVDFFPLTCDYVEKTYAAGRIPGGFFKREGRQRNSEILSSRVIDRPLRPLFPDGFRMETQIIATVLSHDSQNQGDVLAMIGASACVHLSCLPWDGPTAAIRVGRVDGELVANPTLSQLDTSDFDILVACTRDAIVMVEGGAKEISERELADILEFAHDNAQPVIDLIEEMRAVAGKPKMAFTPPALEPAVQERVKAICDAAIREAAVIKEKHARYDAYRAIKEKLVETLTAELGEEKFEEQAKLVKAEFEERKYHVVREMVLKDKSRIDGRNYRQIRPIMVEPGLLARTHGSALFQRGETQAVTTTTLGTTSDEQKIDDLQGESWKRFYLHYNFPPFCTGETKFLRGPARREIGHGNLAERAIERILPAKEEFPYTIRIVSETLESNGSSSMAAVCGGCLSLMDAGVPIKAPVAGIAMGLISDGARYAVLSDILGDEDHLGDMDFKVCGTERGITAIQMDIKVKGLTREIMLEALEQAREGRLHILGKMLEVLPAARPELSKYAPRIVTVKVKPEQIRLIIGPGGKTIKGIVDQTGVTVDVEDDGTVNVASADADGLRRALDIIAGLTAEPEVGKVYEGTVRRIADFGAFVEFLPNWDGLVHISELAWGRTERVEDVCKEGDRLNVKVLSVDADGKVRLSHKDTLPRPEGMEDIPRADRGPRDRGPRDRDRGPRDRGPRDRDRGPRDRGPRDRDRGPRGGHEGGDRGESREPREGREPREPRESREPREGREPREPRESREPREGREPREEREPREPRGKGGEYQVEVRDEDIERAGSNGDGERSHRARRRRTTTTTPGEDSAPISDEGTSRRRR